MDTVSTGSDGSRSSTLSPIAFATAARSCCAINCGSTCVISPNEGCPCRSSKRTGTTPTFNSSRTSEAPLDPRSTNAVPSVGWPANGSSSATVKMRTRIPRSRSFGALAGTTKVVSERLVSRAIACICSVVNSRPSRHTAKALPVSGQSVNTSICTIRNFFEVAIKLNPPRRQHQTRHVR